MTNGHALLDQKISPIKNGVELIFINPDFGTIIITKGTNTFQV
jgi:hypothetical protein